MQILLVSELFPPLAHAEAFCTGKLSQALLARGHGVDVLTTPPGYWREHVPDHSPAWSRPLGRVAAPPVSGSRLARHAADAIAALRARTPGMKGWHEAARKAALSLARERRVDLVMTRYNATRTAWVGWALKRRFGIPWIAYFPDPTPRFLAPPPYGAGRPETLRDRAQVRRARRMLRDADALAFPCERLAAYTLRGLGLEDRRVVILPHIGWRAERAALPTSQASPASPAAGIQILHAGIFMQHRYPDAFLVGLVALRDAARRLEVSARVDFLGETKEAGPNRLRERGVGDVVRFPGLVSYEESLERMRSATALLLLEVPMAEGVYLASKWCDYALAGRPVLCFSPEVGTVADVLGRDHPGLLGQTADGAARGLTRFVEAAAEAAASGRDDALAAWRVDGASRYSADAVMTSFESQIRGIV